MARKPPVPGKAAQPAPDFAQRGTERVPVTSATELRQQNWYSVEVTIKNVSTSGFMAETGQPIRIGSYVSLDVPGIGPVNAQVRWQIGRRMGGMFLDPISLSRCQWVATASEPPTDE